MRTIKTFTLICFLCFFAGCAEKNNPVKSDKSDEEEVNPDKNDDKEDEKDEPNNTFAVCLDWGCTQEDVESGMSNCKINYSNENIMVYYGWEDFFRISYQFDNGRLQASLILININKDDAIKKLYEGYLYIGEFNGIHIYLNETENVFSTLEQQTHDGKDYYAVGYTSIK